MRLSLVMVGLLAVFAGCGEKVNDTLLVVNATISDLEPGTDVDRIDIDATPARGAAAHRSFDVQASTGLPVKMGLVPVGSPALGVVVNVTAWKNDVLVVGQRAELTFVPNQARQIRVVLARACAALTCPASDTCRSGACVAAAISTDELEPYPGDGVDAAVEPDAAPPPVDGSAPDVALPEPGQWNAVEVTLPGLNQTALNFTSLAVLDDGKIIIVGYAGVQGIALRGEGSTFERLTLPAGTPPLYGVWADSEDNVWAVGAQGTIIQRTAAGFTSVSSGTTAVLTSVFGFGAKDTWAVGANATLLHEQGNGWERVTAPTVVGNLNSISGTAADDVWIVGSEGGVFRGNAEGWARVDQTLTRNLLYSVWAVARRDVWAVGDHVALHWNGTRFTSTSLPLDTALGVWGADGNDVWAVGRPASGGSPLARWTGNEWKPFAAPLTGSLQNVRGKTKKNVSAVGNMGALLRFSPLP